MNNSGPDIRIYFIFDSGGKINADPDPQPWLNVFNELKFCAGEGEPFRRVLPDGRVPAYAAPRGRPTAHPAAPFPRLLRRHPPFLSSRQYGCALLCLGRVRGSSAANTGIQLSSIFVLDAYLVGDAITVCGGVLLFSVKHSLSLYLLLFL